MSPIKHALPPLAGIFGKRVALCCPGGVPNLLVEQFRGEGLHLGRLR